MLTLPLILLAIAIAIPIAVVAAETLAALFVSPSPSRRAGISPSPPLALSPSPSVVSDIRYPLSEIRYSAAVLIPAHNEEAGIAATIASIRPQLQPGDRILVVADNCTDATAAVARSAGAEVIERHSQTERGKGFALAAGLDLLRNTPPEVVLVVDADMKLAEGSLAALVQKCVRSGQPVQCVDLLETESDATAASQISAFAFAFKNLVRAAGAEILGIPCLLRGTGMAFPWKIISEAKLATGNIVEDMQLGMDLAIAGHCPRFCPEARVVGRLPDKAPAATTQRTRWEHGHLQTILHNCPRLLWQGIRQCRPSLIALALDLAVPPLALLALMWCIAAAAAGGFWWLGLSSRLPLLILLAGGLALAASILLAWWRFARDILPAATLLSVPLYILWKIPLYFAFLFKRQKAWVRTAR